MAVVKVVNKFYEGWNIGDHVEMDGKQLKAELAEGNVVLTEGFVEEPIAEPVEVKVEETQAEPEVKPETEEPKE